MKWHPWIASVLVGLGVASCGENGPPPGQSNTTMKPAMLKAGATGTQTGAKLARQPGSTGSDMPVPPKDTQWTIMCDSVEGPGHVENARDVKAMLARRSGMPDWYIVHNERESTIYYGFYRSLDNPAEKRRVQEDRTRLAMVSDNLGNRLVRGNVLVAVNAPDPEAPPEWNLVKTPASAYWSIEIATFAGDARRKEAAVDMVRQLREHGEKDAYYFHGPSASSVCIGAWPRDAVREQGTGIDRHGNARDDAHAVSADQPIVVFGDVIPPNIAADVREPGTGKRMLVEGMQLEYLDPTMKEKAREYPVHAVNYEVRGLTNGGKTIPDPSVLIMIPHDQSGTGEDDSLLTIGSHPDGGAQASERRAPSSPGDSALRSIGDH